MTNGDDESDADTPDGEESAEAADQASAEKAGAAESELGSGEDNPTAQEIAADEDTGSDAEGEDGDDDIEPSEETAEESDETDTSDEEDAASGEDGDAEGNGDTKDDDTADSEDVEDASQNENEADDTAEEDTEDEETSEDADEDATDDESDVDEESDQDESDVDEDGENSKDDAIETKHTPESLDDRLDEIETAVEEANTEADLDAAEADLDECEADIESADLPESDEDEDDEDEVEDDANDERTRGELESRVTELREAIESQRGPYAEDVVETVEGAKTTITETRWTDQGDREVAEAVEDFLDAAGDTLDDSFAVESGTDADGENEAATDGGDGQEDAEDDADKHAGLVAALDDVIDAIEQRDLDPDEDEATIADLLDAAEELTENLDDAEEWDDLTVREKLAAEGFYDVLEAENRKDFPPEWNAIKIYEKRNEPEPILRGLEMFGSDFMEEHCIESLKRLGAPAAFDAMEQRAQKRDKPPIEALGKIGDDRALETLHEYIEGESDPGLQKVTLKALGEIGSDESTQPVADRLVADNETVRSNAARALGLIGDARAIDPLADVLREDDSNSVRASAAWALNQIGTETALDAARDHADDRSYLVQTEAEKAEHAMADDGDTAEQAA